MDFSKVTDQELTDKAKNQGRDHEPWNNGKQNRGTVQSHTIRGPNGEQAVVIGQLAPQQSVSEKIEARKSRLKKAKERRKGAIESTTSVHIRNSENPIPVVKGLKPGGVVRVPAKSEPKEIPPEIDKLEENLQPRRKSRVVERGYERNHKLVELAKRRAIYRCEVKGCSTKLFIKPDGYRYVEVHHLIMMADGGPDTLENMACLCPNCHRELHYGRYKEELKIQLQRLRAKE